MTDEEKVLRWEAIQLIPNGIYSPDDWEHLVQMCLKHLKEQKEKSGDDTLSA